MRPGLRLLLLGVTMTAGFWSLWPVGLWLVENTAPVTALAGSCAYFAVISLVARRLAGADATAPDERQEPTSKPPTQLER